MNKLFKLNRKGFTLIELIVVVAVLGILVGIAVPKFLNSTEDAKIATMQADAKVLSNAALQYNIKNDAWPVGDPAVEAFVIKDGFTDEMEAIFSGYDTATVYKLDETALNDYIKNLSGEYENYVLVTDGEFEGEVFHVNGMDNGKDYFNGIYEVKEVEEVVEP